MPREFLLVRWITSNSSSERPLPTATHVNSPTRHAIAWQDPDFTDPAVREWWGELYEERLRQADRMESVGRLAGAELLGAGVGAPPAQI